MMPNKKSLKSLTLICAPVVFFLLSVQSVFAQDRLSAEELKTAQSLFLSCQACHGEQGQGNPALNSPALAGQYAWYTRRQLEHFRTGLRGSESGDGPGQQMAAISRQLSGEKELALLAAYIETLAVSSLVDDSSGTGNKNGYRYYQGKCGACHGSRGQGNVAFNAPKLTGQASGYLLTQMKHFSEGKRGAHKKDKFGRQMAMMAKTVTKEQLGDIIDYLGAL